MNSKIKDLVKSKIVSIALNNNPLGIYKVTFDNDHFEKHDIIYPIGINSNWLVTDKQDSSNTYTIRYIGENAPSDLSMFLENAEWGITNYARFRNETKIPVIEELTDGMVSINDNCIKIAVNKSNFETTDLDLKISSGMLLDSGLNPNKPISLSIEISNNNCNCTQCNCQKCQTTK